MSEPLGATLERWHDFYLLVGTAAATLVALLFVAASIGAGFLRAEGAAATRIYMSPVVLHFTSVLVACAVGLVPSHTRMSLALIIGAGAVGGLAVSGHLLVRVLKDPSTDWSDNLAYGIAPAVGYLAALVAAVLFLVGSPRAPEVLAGALIWLLVDNIRNAWDLALFMARKQSEAKR